MLVEQQNGKVVKTNLTKSYNVIIHMKLQNKSFMNESTIR